MPSFPELVAALALVLGTFFMVVACVGLIRLPDVYCRMHAAGKAGTMGVVLMIVAPVIYFAPQEMSVPIRGALAIFFQFLTTPAATHLLCRASYVSQYSHDERTDIDELKVFLPARPYETYGEE